MSYETFVSAVLLRQGDADFFLKSKPKERSTRLLEVLDLAFYQKLGEAAARRRKDWKDKLDDRQQALNAESEVTVESIGLQEEAVRLAGERAKNLQTAISEKEAEIRFAEQAENLLARIGELRAQQQADQVLIEHEENIRERVSRLQRLQVDLPRLREIWSVRKTLADERSRLSQRNRALRDAHQVVVNRETERQAAEARLIEAAERKEEARKTVEGLAGELSRNKEDLRAMEEIERHEKDIREWQASLDPHRPNLEQAISIERDWERRVSLNECLPALAALRKALDDLEEAYKAEADADAEADRLKSAQETARALEKEQASRLEAAKQALSGLQEDRAHLRETLTQVKHKLADRQRIADEQECPVCGSRLDSTTDQERLAIERSKLEGEVQALGTQLEDLEGKIRDGEAGKKREEEALKAAQGSLRRAELSLAAGETNLKNRKAATRQTERAQQVAQHRAERWTGDLPRLAELSEEFSQLAGAQGAWDQLQEARRVESAANAVIAKSQESLGRLPSLTLEERISIRQKSMQIAQWQARVEKERQDAESAHRSTEAALRSAQDAEGKAGEAVRLIEIQIGDLSERAVRAERDLAAKVDALPAALASHPAVEEAEALGNLEKELLGLSGADDEERLLRETERRRANLAGQIQATEDDLAKIPQDLRRPSEDVRQECEDLARQAEKADRAHEQARRRLAELLAQKETFERMLAGLQEANREYVRWEKLARILGRSGLQTQILRMAQEAVQANANTTLSHLTGGNLKVVLPYGDLESGMEIQIQDTSQSGEPRRAFEYLSGGEKFRVAISFAVAIGQSFSGGRAVDTLIIDEGFGALDEPNRGRLVEELRRLSEDLLRGGRVIVVSHQDDVADEFGSFYRITKTPHGRIQVEYNL